MCNGIGTQHSPYNQLSNTDPGYHVSRHPFRHDRPETLPQTEPVVTHHRPIYHVHRPGRQLLFPEHNSPHPHAGRALRHRRLHLVLSLHSVHGSVVRSA